jgi:uncharacterized repeat protein (TIGR01451 family)
MNTHSPRLSPKYALWAVILAGLAAAQGGGEALQVKSIAEVEAKVTERGRPVAKLVSADRVVPGDRVIYTLQVRNTGTAVIDMPTIVNPVPAHMMYVADSAVGPGADVSYSVDGGHLFDVAANLKVPGADGRARAAVVADYTHIRWQLKNKLKPNSVALLRFRAVVK